ncbi:hypothetical protein EDF31_11544 [Curtobacterium sp. PhB142]|nr:hypothetical protein EDF31_11544 [Curtobacterium sp. PhB142]TCL99557.1 hypothetical protein EDF26_1168 [Curtobacterium sp. PhB134]TCU82114.1 hypothetical protein EDF48_1138 [Curtobacterium sp. PhB191]
MSVRLKTKSALGGVIGVALTVSGLGATGPATAAEKPGAQDARAAWGSYHKIISKTSTGSHVGSQKLASCGSRTAAMDCSLTRGRTANRTIGLDLGASRGWAAGQLKISASTTQSVSVTCSKRKVPKGKQLVAYPVGVRYKYKIQKHITGAGKDYVSGTSKWLYAFNPGSARVSCDIRSF